jgi:anaerobic selenocysteine-containing dehydrogenase
MSRRDFLQVMGIVGGAGAVAFVSAASSLGSSLTAEASEAVTESEPVASQAQAATAASSCSVLCPRGCSYPGRCHRYQDSNQNGRCDLGECV